MSQAVATSGDRWQIERRRKRLKRAKTVAMGCDRLPPAPHGWSPQVQTRISKTAKTESGAVDSCSSGDSGGPVFGNVPRRLRRTMIVRLS
jgi:hypothetical protein